MSTQRERLAAFKAAVGAVPDLRCGMTTVDAVALAGELKESDQRFPAQLSQAIKAWNAIGPMPTDPEALLAHAGSLKSASAAFWDAFEGQIVDGVEIIRRRT